MPFLKIRQLEPEIMDDPLLSDEEHERALQGLARVHWLTGSTQRLWLKLLPLLRQQKTGAPLRVMDVGCGDGLMLRQLAVKCQRHGFPIQPIGCDLSERALAMTATAARRDGLEIELHRVDVTQQALPVDADVIICSLFLHHFSEPQVVAILKQFGSSARRLLLVEDLLRSPLGYYLCWLGVHVLTRSRVVHTDGLLSVRAAFTLPEIEGLISETEITGARLSKHWPERFFLEWQPEGTA